MLLDAKTLTSNDELTCELCIVGAGAAGITMALELADSGMDIILLEAGSINNSGKSQQLYQGSVNDRQRHLPTDQARYRQLGGTTSMWGGRCLPYDPIDFDERSHVPYGSWPINRDQLNTYYAKAHEYCQCGAFEYNIKQAIPDAISELIPGFTDGELNTTTIERWSPPTHFGKVYKNALENSKTVRVYTNLTATEIETNENGDQVTGLTVHTFPDQQFKVTANNFVLAGGGFEVTRLLLNSDKVHKHGIGNHSDWLGRCYMPHIHGVISRLKFNDDLPIAFGYEQDADGVYCRRRLWLSEACQKSNEILNAYFLLDRPLLGDPNHGNALLSLAFIAKKLRKKSIEADIGTSKYGLYWSHIKNILTGSAGIISVLPQFSRKRFLQSRRIPSLLLKPKNNSFSLYFQSEQVPNRDSRITLSDQTDQFGMKQINVDFKIHELDVNSVYKSHQLIGEELKQQGLGELTFNSDDPLEDIRNCHAVMGHHIGTTRMSSDPKLGVVDGNCQVHNMTNLFIASSSVFTTSSQANPVLTIVALTIRLSDYLKQLK